jgi:hypothetical protein
MERKKKTNKAGESMRKREKRKREGRETGR